MPLHFVVFLAGLRALIVFHRVLFYFLLGMLLLFLVGHLVITLWDLVKNRTLSEVSSLKMHIDTVQNKTLGSIQKNVMEPMQESLSKMRTRLEILQDREGQNFLKSDHEQ